METREVQTALGVIPVFGSFTDRPRVLVITGAFAEPDEMSRFPVAMEPDYDGLVARLPGQYSPALSETSIPFWGRAFDEVAAQLGVVVVVGLSVGALVALSMREPKRIVAVEPPLSTAKLWPMIPTMRRLRGHPEFIEKVLGVYPDHVAERGYWTLLDDLETPTDVILGSEPLMPEREVARYPSLVDEPERQRLLDHPAITVHVAPNAGHAVPWQATMFMHSILLSACEKARG